MELFKINGGKKLHGTITPAGNKNAALPLLAATLLSSEPIVLRNIPNIQDVLTMRNLLQSLGVDIKVLDLNTWEIKAAQVRPRDLDPSICRRIRASILLAGPMAARCNEFSLPPPGGDVIGRRRVDTHALALEALGVACDYNRVKKIFRFETKSLSGARILLDEASVTATENAIMAAVKAKGETVLQNAASEPHVQELCHFLNRMGAKIEQIGSNTLHIQGVSELGGTDYTIGPDYLEVVSFVGAAVVTGGDIRIKQAGLRHLDLIGVVLGRLGVGWTVEGDDLLVKPGQNLCIKADLGDAIPEISVMPWPGFPTDLMSIAIVIATQAQGTVLFHDWMYPSRMFFIDKLVAMGAQIVFCDPHRCIVHGPTQLVGENLESPDIRAGMALVLAALAANGQSIIRNVAQIDRGYEQVDQKLLSLGADLTRVVEN